MTIRKLLIGVIGVAALLVGAPGPAHAGVCANGVNASVLGDAEQDNDCPTSVDVGLPETPALPTP